MTVGEIALQLFNGVLARDREVVNKLLAEDAIWHVPGRRDLDVRGNQAFLDGILALDEVFDEPLQFTILKIHASDESATVVCHNTGRIGDNHLNLRMAFVLAIRDGKVIDVDEYPEDPAAWTGFWIEGGLFPAATN